MSVEIPIGRREGTQLEFKSLAALKNPSSIAREVVSMLNADGGAVWIGLVEHDGIATREENVPDAHNARIALLNSLLDRIVPEPRDEDIRVEVVPGVSVENVLRITVTPNPAKQPYALRDNGLTFLTRVDHRVRPMTREEIIGPRGRSQQEPDERAARLLAAREKILALREDRYWIGVQPSTALEFDTDDPVLAQFLIEPSLAGNRRSGWTYGGQGLTVERATEGAWFVGELQHRRLSLTHDGMLELTMPLNWLAVGLMPQHGDLHPLALLEYPISVMRLMKRVHERSRRKATRFLIDLVLTAKNDWAIPPYAPGTYGYALAGHRKPRKVEDFIPDSPWSVTARELDENPDRVGYRIVRELYASLGLQAENVPTAYDVKTERFTLTD